MEIKFDLEDVLFMSNTACENFYSEQKKDLNITKAI